MILATVSPDRDFHGEVCAALRGKLRFEAVWDLNYDGGSRLHGVNSDQKCLVILDFADGARGLELARSMAGRAQLVTIAVGSGNGSEELLRLMQAGVRDVLTRFSPRDLLQAIHRAAGGPGIAGNMSADLYAFLPAKPGCGATTVATYATGMAAALSEDPILLMDFDLRLGVTTFLLKAEGTRTIADALQHVHRLDRDLWSSAVSQIGNLHLLGSGPVDLSETVSTEQFAALLDFAMARYSLAAVDLAGSMEDHESAALLRSKQIFLVCSPDVGALHLARRKTAWFRELQVLDRVSVILNRTERRDPLSVEEIERILDLPVRYSLPSDVKEVSKAVQRGRILEGPSPLAKQLARVAEDMVPARPGLNRPTPVRRFVEYFSVSPFRDSSVGR